FRRPRADVDVVVRVISDRVPLPNDLLEPGNVRLLEDPADGEAVDHSAMSAHAATRLDRVTLRLVVEVSLLVVPVRVFPAREVAAHLQIERDGHERPVARRRLVGPCRRRQRGRARREEAPAIDGWYAHGWPATGRERIHDICVTR